MSRQTIDDLPTPALILDRAILSRNLNVRDLLGHEWLLLTKAAVEQMAEVLG